MAGRIETVYSGKQDSSYKYSKNEIYSAREAGVDIGKDDGGGGTTPTSYNSLSDKPAINGVELAGDLRSDQDLNIAPLTNAQLDAIMALI